MESIRTVLLANNYSGYSLSSDGTTIGAYGNDGNGSNTRIYKNIAVLGPNS